MHGSSGILTHVGFSLLLLGGSAGCSAHQAGTSTGGTTGSSSAGLIIDAGNYTLTVLAPALAGSCDVHATQPPQFQDATAGWGLSNAAFTYYHAIDFDHDGYPDLLAMSGNAERQPILTDGGFGPDVAVLMNRPLPDGGRFFHDETAESGLFQTRGGSTTEYRMSLNAVAADLNGDGNLDVFSMVGAPYLPDAGPIGQDTNEVLLNDGHGHFSFAPQSAPATTGEPSNYGAAFTDIDNDGKLDLLLSYWYPAGDNGDLNGSQAQLYRGNGDGTLTSIAQNGGLETNNSGTVATVIKGTNPRPSFSALACDLNGDGYPELLLSAYGGESNMLYVNDGTGNFTRLYQDGGFDCDTDDDYHDNAYYLCYCTVHGSSAYCAGAARPTVVCPMPADSYWEPGVSDAPALLCGNNFSAACRDMYGSGRPDLFQADIRHWWAGQSTDPSSLMVNVTPDGGPIAVQRVSGAIDGVVFPHIDPQGWNEGVQYASLVDMDNDGRPDILTGVSDYPYQYGHLFAQQPDGTFQDMAQAWGLIFPCMDGIEVADFDRNGDLDVVVRGSLYRNCAKANGGWARLKNTADGGILDPGFAGYTTNENHLFLNNAATHANWLEIRLRGDGQTTNTMGLGAAVTITTADGVVQNQQMQDGHGLGSQSDDPGVMFVGLGNCAAVNQISVRWPNRTLSTDVWTNVPANKLVELRQGDPTLYGINLP